MIKLIAFDWNGTLLADTADCTDACNLLLKDYGKKTITVNKYRRSFRIPVVDFYIDFGFKRNFLLANSKRIGKKYMGYYESIAARCRTRSGVKNLLLWLEKNHINNVIFSNHTISGIQSQIKRLALDDYLKIVLAHGETHHNNMHKRGKEEKLVDFVKKRGYKKSEVLVIGDTDEEIQIGKKHGFYTVGITGGNQIASMITKHHPDFLIHNMKDLVGIIKKLNKRPEGSSRT